MNATDAVVSKSATFVATVDFPEPDPPAIPIIKGLSICLKPTLEINGTHYAALSRYSTAARSRPHHENPIDVLCPFAYWHWCVQRVFSRLRYLPAERSDGPPG